MIWNYDSQDYACSELAEEEYASDPSQMTETNLLQPEHKTSEH